MHEVYMRVRGPCSPSIMLVQHVTNQTLCIASAMLRKQILQAVLQPLLHHAWP